MARNVVKLVKILLIGGAALVWVLVITSNRFEEIQRLIEMKLALQHIDYFQFYLGIAVIMLHLLWMRRYL